MIFIVVANMCQQVDGLLTVTAEGGHRMLTIENNKKGHFVTPAKEEMDAVLNMEDDHG